jgi:hypothetical protein
MKISTLLLENYFDKVAEFPAERDAIIVKHTRNEQAVTTPEFRKTKYFVRQYAEHPVNNRSLLLKKHASF